MWSSSVSVVCKSSSTGPGRNRTQQPPLLPWSLLPWQLGRVPRARAEDEGSPRGKFLGPKLGFGELEAGLGGDTK